ncbi:endomucin [Peromyscus californicus insignis]|uniref:endomucin n=1 Tax=Peromyscus californicus insignis TaxID=564181 RepID=UPI0022A77345|nr:endomucin [Peromyscus californicus insignis]
MRLLQVAALFFLVSSRVCHSEDSEDVQNKSTPSLPENSTTKLSVTTPGTVAVTNLNNPTVGTPAKGTANGELSKTTLVPAFNSQTTVKTEEPTTPSVIKNEVPTTDTTVPNPPVSNAVSTLPSSQHKAENQNSIKTPEVPVATQLPDALPKTTVLPSASLTTAKTISQLQDTEDGKITATPSTTPSYSSIILPVVIALIVITLLVFTLVGLYRMCWKRDPGTPENGNDQPQSDKESVKLLTVKTISHESGEHSAQGKTKN